MQEAQCSTGILLAINQGGEETYSASATNCTFAPPIALSSNAVVFATGKNRYSSTSTARYATEAVFSSSNIIVKLYAVAATGAASYPSADTPFKYIAIGTAA